ncbi:hypothetical protein ESZ00_17040 [Silvibacterium dinghuense]|uniref:Uncharacterized protein n=2 Tax=Silvibacterium dinghuense TaxID=1560006 RepID=A0A4V1NUX3_9BACT|nr:hypothetical protein [Silvibacterium dinghuense]RXS93754.1 hypothetical protein ESZ00_17040 [Silvibacterium dinghuense]
MTLIVRDRSTDGTLAPPAVNYLDNIPEDVLFYREHCQLHPSAIYNRSLEKIARAFCSVTKEYFLETDNLRRDKDAALDVSQLLDYQVHFLRTMQEYLDELWLILKTLIDPKLASKSSEFTEQYVLDNKLPGAKSFQEAIRDYKSTLRIANKLKHQQCFLRVVAAWFGRDVHLGYCLEEPDTNGILGPSPEVHPDQGAFSFARDLTWHMANVYRGSDKLINAVQKVLSAKGISLPKTKVADHLQWDAAITELGKIPMAYFPKEMRKPIAKFNLDDSSQILKIKLPYQMAVQVPYPNRVGYLFTPHKHSLSCRLPLL